MIGRDFNADRNQKRERGDMLQEWTSSLDFIMVSNENTPTFHRGSSRSHPDVTLIDSTVAYKVPEWTVRDDVENLSDHHYITFKIEEESGTSTREGNENVHFWEIGPDLQEFSNILLE